jgi:acetyl esterase/lipase
MISAVLLAVILAGELAWGQPDAAPRRGPQADTSSLPEGTRVLRDLAYVSGGGERQKLDLYLPSGTNASLPLIIWIHGGAWLGGSKDRCPAVRFLGKGYAVASINYRLSQHAVFPAQIQDCKAAVRWLRAHATEYHLNPDRFGVWGASAGGHLVALLGLSGGEKEFDSGENLPVSSRVQAVVDFFGPADLLTMGAQSGANSRMDHNAADSPESKLIGGPVQKLKDKARTASPINYISKDDPPMLLVHGDADPLVPVDQSKDLHAALQKAGVESVLYIVKDGGHGNKFGPEVPGKVEAFFAKYLKGQ